jgi:tetratricopeptide (TPR) repeat protein
MKRPQRNLFIIMSVMMAVYLIGTRLPFAIVTWLLVASLLVGAALCIWGRDFFVGRQCTRQRKWQEAAKRYQRFETKLLAAPWRKLAIVLYFGIYTFDGVALARNHVAQSLINLGDLDGAEQWLRRALQSDPMYALPYLNLGVVAALRGDQARAAREMGKAVQLGFNPDDAHRLLRRTLASVHDATDRTPR